MRILRISSAVGVAALLLVGALPAAAQQVGIQAPPPEKAPEARVVTPPLIYETTRPPDADYYPETPRVEHNPAFLEPLAQPYTTPSNSGRKGLAGWTSPTTPVGPSSLYSEWTGVLAVGFSVTWDGPPPTPKRPAP